MKYLLSLVLIFSLSTAVHAEEDLCDSVAVLAYVIADDYYNNGTAAYYLYAKAETVLEASIIDTMVETQAEPLTLAYGFREICLRNKTVIEEAIYTPL